MADVIQTTQGMMYVVGVLGTRNVPASGTIDPNTTVYVANVFEIPTGATIEIGSGSTLEIG